MRVWVGKRQAASGCWVGKRRAASSACALRPCSILHHCSAQLPNVVSVAWRAGGSPGAPEARLARRRLALVSSAHQGTKTLNGLAFERAFGSTKGALGSGAPTVALMGAMVPPVPLLRPRLQLRLLDGAA